MLKLQLSISSQPWCPIFVLPPWTPAFVKSRKKNLCSSATGYLLISKTDLIALLRKTVLPCRLRKLRHQPQRYRQLIQLEVRPQERDRFENSRLGLVFDYFYARFAQRILGLDGMGRGIVLRDVSDDPVIQEDLGILARRRAADLVA